MELKHIPHLAKELNCVVGNIGRRGQGRIGRARRQELRHGEGIRVGR